LTNANGCDSIVTLNLTINQNSSSTIDEEACGSYTADNGQTYTESATFSYTIPSQNGCDSIITVNLTVFDDPVINISPSGVTEIEPGDSIQLSASGATSYSWTPIGSLSCSNCPSPLAYPTTTTTYTVTGTDENGCAASTQTMISVQIQCDEFFVPTVFSPNGEGPEANDQLCIFGNCISEVRYEVYNRWGEAVFSTTDQSKCWDGTYKGEPLQTGIYMYRLYAKLFDGTIVEQSGNLTILK
jgi:gliding motility-associated-like protein